MSHPSPAWLPRPAWAVMQLAGSVSRCAPLRCRRIYAEAVSLRRPRVLPLLKPAAWFLQARQQVPLFLRSRPLGPGTGSACVQDRLLTLPFPEVAFATSGPALRPFGCEIHPETFAPWCSRSSRPTGLHSREASIAAGLLPDHRTALAASFGRFHGFRCVTRTSPHDRHLSFTWKRLIIQALRSHPVFEACLRSALRPAVHGPCMAFQPFWRNCLINPHVHRLAPVNTSDWQPRG